MRQYKAWAVLLLLFITACAGSPEARLKQGYATVSTSARTATILLDRGQISVVEGERVLALNRTAKASLDDGYAKLIICRADEAAGKPVDCSKAISNIHLGSGVLLQLEQYLEANQK